MLLKLLNALLSFFHAYKSSFFKIRIIYYRDTGDLILEMIRCNMPEKAGNQYFRAHRDFLHKQ